MAAKQRKHGPHGGAWIPTIDGYVEVSIFDIDSPPRLRLYFFDLAGNPVPAPASENIKLETVRLNKVHQSFSFTATYDFLEAADILPEPHAFDATVEIIYNNHAHQYKIQFSEEDHVHTGEVHSHVHAYSHVNGFFATLYGLIGHSHNITDKIDESMESNELGIKTLKTTLIILLATAIIQLVVALASGSIALLADTIHNFADATTSIPLWIAFSLARRGASRRFTYGYGKAEDVAGVIIVLIIFFSACVAAFESIRKIINPTPMGNLGWVALAAIIGFLGNEFVALYRIRTGKAIGSAALIADGYHARADGITSLAVLLGVAGTWFGFHLVDPLVGILITIAILFIVKDTAKSVWIRLIDGIEPEILAQIEHAPTHISGVTSVHEVRARWIGHRVYAEVTIYVDPSISVNQADAMSKKVEHALHVHVPLLSAAVVRIKPVESIQLQ